MTPEHQRLAAAGTGNGEWQKWGPYLSERQWGTVREDLSVTGDPWSAFPHDHARSRAYRWGEDGLAGLSDDRQILCFALALWNGADPILKERLFGLTNTEGNHGEDVKEYYSYLDGIPTHSYMRYLYRYSQNPYPYDELIDKNRTRNRQEPEYELIDTEVFSDNRYFDIDVEYAKAAPEDLLITITVSNHADTAAELHLLPTLWFRNTWSWTAASPQPNLSQAQGPGSVSVITAIHHELGDYYLYCDRVVPLLFTDNETNAFRLYGQANRTPFVKDGINDAVVNGRTDAVNPAKSGTKAAAHYRLTLTPHGSETARLRLTNLSPSALRSNAGRGGVKPFAVTFEQTFAARREEADAFYATVIPPHLDADSRDVMRRVLAGALWSQLVYHYDVETWLGEHGIDAWGGGDPCIRNRDWHTFNASDVLSVPDKWEYPWFAAWDLAFQAVPLAMVDPASAKRQLSLLISTRYLHSSGQIPAYEWNFSDVNPPVHAWATHWVYHADRQHADGVGDVDFYKRSFTTLIANYTWWMNRRDGDGRGVASGGLLGFDNIGAFDRSAPLPAGGPLESSEATAWLAFYAASMLTIAIDLARTDTSYADTSYADWAGRFVEFFMRITRSMDHIGAGNDELWDEGDGFFYHVLSSPNGERAQPKVRSVAGLLPLCAVVVYDPPANGDRLSDLTGRSLAFLDRYPGLATAIAAPSGPGPAGRLMLSAVSEARLRRLLGRLLDPSEFLSAYGIRSLSRHHHDAPVTFRIGGEDIRVAYEPGESVSGAFGGNTNWRGPVWLPVNLLIIDALLKYYLYYGDAFTVEFPTGSGLTATLYEVAAQIAVRLCRIFRVDAASGRRPVFGECATLATDPKWRDLVPFHESFHGDTGAGLGASHQTGWSGAIAKLMQFFATTTAAETLERGLILAAGPALVPQPEAETPRR